MTEYVVLNSHTHSKLSVLETLDFSAVKERQFMPLTVNELAPASSSFPAVILKDGHSGQFVITALLGLEDAQNLILSPEQIWSAVYVPQVIQCEPFTLAPSADKPDSYAFCVNIQSSLVMQAGGRALFDEEGETAFLKGAKARLLQNIENQTRSTAFINALIDRKLLTAFSLSIEFSSGRSKLIKGLYTVDEEALKQLADSEIVSLFKHDYLDAIYAMLRSLMQLNRLIQLNNQRADYDDIKLLKMHSANNDG
jgi:hypothetical protein